MLIAGVTGEAPEVLIAGNIHHRSLTPSAVSNLEKADVVFWLGPSLNPEVSDLLEDHPAAIALDQASLPTLIEIGEGEHGDDDGHDGDRRAKRKGHEGHHDDGHEGHHDDGHEGHHDDDHEGHHDDGHEGHHDDDHEGHHDDGHEGHHDDDHEGHHDDDHEGHHDDDHEGHHDDDHEGHHDDDHEGHHHHHEGTDPHVWLDIDNVITLTIFIADELSRLDPAKASLYQQNASASVSRLRAVDEEIRQALAPVAARPYLNSHGAYAYFAQRYGLTLHRAMDEGRQAWFSRPESMRRIRREIKDEQIACLVSTPEDNRGRRIEKLAQESAINFTVIDQVGAEFTQMDDFLRDMATKFVVCLGGET
ncbi:MAG: metal ABC transporter substrate-binding protein [Pseudomonadota bacterium]